MKYLLLCEGPNEVCIVNLLLKYGKLKFNTDDLLALKPFNARQLTNPTIKSELRVYNKPVIILRIGDTQRDKLEILLIINEGLYKKYVRSKEKPKTFAKKNIFYNNRRYNQSNEFLLDYYSGKRIDLLIKNLKEYKHLKKHKKDELYLADLLK